MNLTKQALSPALVTFSSNIYLSPVGFESMLSRVAGEYGHTVRPYSPLLPTSAMI